MFGLFKKDPKKALEKRYAKLLEEARDLQRGGDIAGFAKKTEEAEAVAAEIDALEADQAG
ncbi:MAG: DUF6435 family protein [Acidobacteriota bacterium]